MKDQNMPRLQAPQITAIRRLFADGKRADKIAKELGLPRSTISRALYHLRLQDAAPDALTPFAQVYRDEKSRRAERPSEAMQAAKKEYRAMLDRQREDQKGGRPRKVKPQVDATRSTDLADLLPTFYGRGAA